jgi:hypothetical protein
VEIYTRDIARAALKHLNSLESDGKKIRHHLGRGDLETQRSSPSTLDVHGGVTHSNLDDFSSGAPDILSAFHIASHV